MSLYKYLTAPGVDLLKRARIRVSKFGKTNDPDEGRITIDYPTDVAFWEKQLDDSVQSDHFYKGVAELRDRDPKRYAQYRKQYAAFCVSQKKSAQRILPKRFIDGIAEHLFFVSLTNSYPNETLWRRYADNHKGFVVCFDDSHAFFRQCADPTGQLQRLNAVKYRERPPIITFGDKEPPVALLTSKLGALWSEENEIRMPCFHPYCHEDGGQHYIDVPKDAISGVIVGNNVSATLHHSLTDINARHFSSRLAVSSEKDIGH